MSAPYKSVVTQAIEAGRFRLGPTPGPRWRSFSLDPASVGLARRFTDEALAEVDDREHVDNVDLVVSELVTNAVRHTAVFGTTAHLGLAVLPRWTHVLVEDPLPDAPDLVSMSDPDPLSLSGRGLGIISALTVRFRFVTCVNDKTAHAIVLHSGVTLTGGEQAALDRLVSV